MKKVKIETIIFLSALAVYILVSVIQHIHFKTYGYDLGLFEQVIWHYSNFQAPISSIRGVPNILGDHFSPILVLAVPFYWIVRSPITLLILQDFLLALAIFPIFKFTKEKLGTFAAIGLSISYALFWGIQSTIGFDFHEVAFAVPMIAFAIYYAEKNKPKIYLPLIALLFFVKEDMSIFIIFFGLYLLYKRRWQQGIALMVSGILIFYIITKFIIPHFSGGAGFVYWDYPAFGANLPEAIITMIKHPTLIFSTLITPTEKIVTIALIFCPFLFLSLFSPLVILAIPLIFERFLSSAFVEWSVRGHYTATIAPILIFACVDGLYMLQKILHNPSLFSKILPCLIILIMIINIATIFVFPFKQLFEGSSYSLSPSEQSGYKALALIPPNASVIAQNPIVSHLAERSNVYTLGYSQKISNADYIIESKNLPIWPFNKFDEIQNLINLKLQNGYISIFNQNGWQVIKRVH